MGLFGLYLVGVGLTKSSDGLWFGVVLTVGGAASFYIGFFTSWFEQEWPLDGREGWLFGGLIAFTCGALVLCGQLVARVFL